MPPLPPPPPASRAPATDSDQSMMLLKEAIQHGWPEKDRVSPQISAYHGIRNELAVTDGLVFLGERLVVPTGLKTHNV